MKYHFLLFIPALLVCCEPPSNTSQASAVPSASSAADQALHQAVAAYIKTHSTDFPGYQPVRWSSPTTYTKANEAAIKGMVAMNAFDEALTPRNQALADYKASLARHDAPAATEAIKARYGKANQYNDSLLAIANKFMSVKDTARLGTGLVHTYRLTKVVGAATLDSATFIVYQNGKVEQL